MSEHVPSGRMAVVMVLASIAAVAMGLSAVVRLHGAQAFSYDAALVLIVCGVGLLSVFYGRRRLATACALIATLMAVVNAAVRLVNSSAPFLGLLRPIPASLAQPMVPRLALCLLLVALSLLLMTVGRGVARRSMILGLTGSTTAGIGIAALLDDIAQSPAMGLTSRFADLLSDPGLALLLLAGGILAFAWRDGRPGDGVGPRWMPVTIAIVVVSVTLVIWQAALAHQDNQRDIALNIETTRLQDHLAESMETRLLVVIRLARRWETQGKPRQDHWESDARMAAGHHKGYQAIEYIEPGGQVRWSAGDGSAPSQAGTSLENDAVQRPLMERSRNRREAVFSHGANLPGGGRGFYLYVPIFVENRFEGVIRGVFSHRALFDNLLHDETSRGFMAAIYEGSTRIYGPPALAGGQAPREAGLELLRLPWKVQLWPTAQLEAEWDSPLDELIPITGILTALLLALTVGLAQQSRRREQQAAAANRDLKREIEQREHTEHQLQQGNAYLNALVASSPLGILAYDSAGRVTMANPAFERIFGYSAGEIVGTNLDQFIAAPGLASEAADLTHRVIAGETVHVTTRRTRADGSEVDVEIFGVPLYSGGKFFSAYALYQDISERQHAEQAVAHERDLLRALMDSIPDRIFFKDAQSRFTRINTTHARALSLSSPEQALGKTDLDFRREHAAQFFAEEQDIIRTGQPLIGQIQKAERPDGTVRYSSVTKAPILNAAGKATGIVGISRDITDWVNAREALVESEARYRVLFESNPYPMFVYDQETLAFLAVNEAAVQHYGYTVDEFLGMTIKDIRPPEDLPRLMEILENMTGDSGQFVARHCKKDRTVFEVEVTAHNLIFAGRPARVVLANDITEKMALEERLRQSQKMEAVGRLAGGVAHDFNNLLTVIIGYGDLLLDRLKHDDRLRRAVEEVRKAAERGASLTRQLLAFSRRQVLQPKVLDLNSAIVATEKMLRRLIGEDIDLVTVLDPTLGWVKADPGQVEQVLLNLAVNARDAMPNGGRLALESRNVELDHTYSASHGGVQPGPYVMLAVSDTGHGMSPDVQAHIFEPFYTTKEGGKGTGLGLATVYGIVKQSGGYVWVYSEPGRGSTFKVYLPRIDQPAGVHPQVANAPAAEVPRGTETVLLAEDEEVVRTLVCEVLQRNGYRVMVARGGPEALQIAADHPGPIHLLLTDMVMAGMSGRELVQRLSPDRPETRILFMSGYTDDSIVKQGMLEAGAAFIQKPFSAEQLARKARIVLDAPAEQARAATT